MKMSVALLRKIIKEELEEMSTFDPKRRVILSPEGDDLLKKPEVKKPTAQHPGTSRGEFTREEVVKLLQQAGRTDEEIAELLGQKFGQP